VVKLRSGLGTEDLQLILVARTICWLEYGRHFRESTVDSDFGAARIMCANRNDHVDTRVALRMSPLFVAKRPLEW
jgi:hypothetical protein